MITGTVHLPRPYFPINNFICRWYCQLQNDCKNVFSSDVITTKGTLAEDLVNGEYTYPILVGLYASRHIKSAIKGAFGRTNNRTKSDAALYRAVIALQSDE